jgi:hypothetical protein
MLRSLFYCLTQIWSRNAILNHHSLFANIQTPSGKQAPSTSSPPFGTRNRFNAKKEGTALDEMSLILLPTRWFFKLRQVQRQQESGGKEGEMVSDGQNRRAVHTPETPFLFSFILQPSSLMLHFNLGGLG